MQKNLGQLNVSQSNDFDFLILQWISLDLIELRLQCEYYQVYVLINNSPIWRYLCCLLNENRQEPIKNLY